MVLSSSLRVRQSTLNFTRFDTGMSVYLSYMMHALEKLDRREKCSVTTHIENKFFSVSVHNSLASFSAR